MSRIQLYVKVKKAVVCLLDSARYMMTRVKTLGSRGSQLSIKVLCEDFHGV
jgi:hypothetical protein